MRSRISGSRFAQEIAGCAIFLALTAASIGIYLAAFAPKRPAPVVVPYDGYDKRPMDEALSPDSIRAEMDAILACGSRFQGQPGFHRARELVRKAFSDANLEIHEHLQKTAAPRTLKREILDMDGRPLPDVEIFPFMPNHFQPIVTPEEGLRGRLTVVSNETLRSCERFDDSIAVIDPEDPPEGFGLNWIPYAQLGFRAVIVAHREGLDKIRWHTMNGMRSSTPVNFPRLAATDGIYRHEGELVTLHVRTVWDEVEDRTLVGAMPSAIPAREAVVITAFCDAPSYLPDLAPGVPGAVNMAVQMALLKALKHYQDDPNRKRDIIFVNYSSHMMACISVDRLTALLGHALSREEARIWLDNERSENDAALRAVSEAAACFEDPRFFEDREFTEEKLNALDPAARDVLLEELRYVLNTVILELSERQLQARLAFIRAGEENLASPEFKAYRAAKRDYDDAMTMAGFPPAKLLDEEEKTRMREGRDGAGFLAAHQIPRRCRERLRELADYHAWRREQIAQSLDINSLFQKYERVIPVGSFLQPADPEKVKGETFTHYMGHGVESYSPLQGPIISDLILSVFQRVKPAANIVYEPFRNRDHNNWASQSIKNVPVDAGLWNGVGHPAFVFVNTDRSDSYSAFSAPVELPYMRKIETMQESLRILGRTVLALVYGEGIFETPVKGGSTPYSGRVFISNVGRSIVPNYPLKHALFGHKGGSGSFEQPGYYAYPFLFTDVYGRYSLPYCKLAMVPWPITGYSPEAVGFDEQGLIRYVKDEGPQGQSIYKSINVGVWGDRRNINIVVFRAAPVTLLDLINPQSLKSYTGWGFLTKEGLAPVTKYNIFGSANGIVTAFLEPDRRFFVSLKAGAPENELVQTERAFLLNVDESFTPPPDREIDGRGYLAADTPFLLDVPAHAARSMLLVNGRRLDLQNRYGMADERTRTFHERSRKLVEESLSPGTPKHEAILKQRDAVTYATLNHPVLRRSISEAVLGIVWYLGLLVPFVFFFEKLVFGFADIRKQIAAQAAIFLTIFVLLRLLHPAFQMIRSSLMILLGFIIMLIAGGITILFAGRFQENLEEIRQKRGRVSAAEINRLGVLGTAFALGLNNMHRRIVRTGLTCATLVLITFAMICFTSVHSDIVNTATAIGRAPYQGLLIKREKMAPISDAELFALRTKYGHRFTVATRRMVVGSQGWDRINYNPDIEAVYEPSEGIPRKTPIASCMEFDPEEPLRNQIRLLTSRGWFTKNLVKELKETPPVLIPSTVAGALGITPSLVDSTNVIITLNSQRAVVYGIFDPVSLAEIRDMDGRDLLPFDIEGMRTVQIVGGSVLAEDSDPRLNAERIIITPSDFCVTGTRGQRRLVSVAVEMPNLSYKQARQEIDRYLEQSGQSTYYGLDEIAYKGKRARERSLAGALELIIPLIIAAMTVLNTMRGSVYERKDEIFVYNAVGIAPRYIFAMFFSEAFVYAVVGSVLGYILSQGAGRVLTALGWTGGLNMTFTSVHTIYASLAIMAAVFFSTLFPARAAMQIAMPAEEIGWTLPEPEGDRMSFDLPFTFDPADRIAVLAFFNRYFTDHGEGSSGKFFSGTPAARISDKLDPLAGDGYIPELATTIWLKPFDLGVSQELAISMPTDPATGEFIARITLTRLSGSRESWLRLNTSFVSLIRRHFLYWRAVSPDERKAMFAEARSMLEEQAAKRRIANA